MISNVTLLLRNVRVVDPSAGIDGARDVLVQDGHIARVAPPGSLAPDGTPSARVLEGEGRWVLPAFVETGAVFGEPGHEYREDVASGLRAAAAGGFAHVAVLPGSRPINDTRAVTELLVKRATEADGPALHPIAAMTRGMKGEEICEFADLQAGGAVAVGDLPTCLAAPVVRLRCFDYARSLGLPLIAQPSEPSLQGHGEVHEGRIAAELGLRGIPSVAEELQLAADLLLAAHTGCRYHALALSSAGSLELVRRARAQGAKVTAGVALSNLFLTEAALADYDTSAKVLPPLRAEADRAALVAGLADGSLEVVTSGHVPLAPGEKDGEFAEALPGAMGLELALPLLLGLVREGALSLPRLVEALSTRPARVLGLEPPSIREGASAELVLVDPERSFLPAGERLASTARNSPFLGRELRGRVLLTLATGRAVFDATGAHT